MNPNKKVLFTFLSFGLAMVIIACLCETPPVTVTPFVDVTATPGATILTCQDSCTVTSATAGVVTSGTGVKLAIPAGAVPWNSDGTVGMMQFSIQEDTTTVVSLPGLVQVGPVVSLQPEGFVFQQPVILSLSIPSAVDPGTVVGAAYFDEGQAIWKLVPGSVDATSRTVQVSTTHLSAWAITGFSVGGSIIGNDPIVPPVNVVDGGFFYVERPPYGIGYGGPDARSHNATSWHGLCVTSVNFADPSFANWWVSPDDFTMLVDNFWGGYTTPDWSTTPKYWMPNGTYQLIEFTGQSEVNANVGDPFYIPQVYDMWRNYPPVTISAGQTVTIPYPSDVVYGAPGWTVDRPPCWGTASAPKECVSCVVITPTVTVPPTEEPVPPTEEPVPPTEEPVIPLPPQPDEMTPDQACACVDRYFQEVQYPESLQYYKETRGSNFVSFEIVQQIPFTYNPSTGACEGHYAHKLCTNYPENPNFCQIVWNDWGNNPGLVDHEYPVDGPYYCSLLP